MDLGHYERRTLAGLAADYPAPSREQRVDHGYYARQAKRNKNIPRPLKPPNAILPSYE